MKIFVAPLCPINVLHAVVRVLSKLFRQFVIYDKKIQTNSEPARFGNSVENKSRYFLQKSTYKGSKYGMKYCMKIFILMMLIYSPMKLRELDSKGNISTWIVLCNLFNLLTFKYIWKPINQIHFLMTKSCARSYCIGIVKTIVLDDVTQMSWKRKNLGSLIRTCLRTYIRLWSVKTCITTI